MKMTKRILSILLTGAMLMSLLCIGVSAAGTQADPIDAETKWFGYGADTYLLNPTLTEGNAEGIWYTLTAKNNGILFLEHSYKNVDYTINVTANGKNYVGGCVNGEPYNRPIITAPLKTGDVITVQIVTKDAAAGTVYANMNVINNSETNTIKVKSAGLSFCVAAGQTLYFQDDSLQAVYATQNTVLSGDSVEGVSLYTMSTNATTGTVTFLKTYADTDGDGKIESAMGGSLGSAGAPAVKPAWAVENTSNEDRYLTLDIVAGAHECNWDDDADVDCNTCGDIREIAACQHAYTNDCDADCDLCGETREDAPHYPVGDHACNIACCVCWADLSTADHQYSFDLDNSCNVCQAERDLGYAMEWGGNSISEDVNGLSARFDIAVEGMATNGSTAIYDNATFMGMKLVSMGAVVCNNFQETNTAPTQDDVDGQRVLDVPAKYLCDVNEEEGTVSFAIRIKNIPDAHKDTYLFFVPYVVLEDAEGNQHIQYVSSWAVGGTYNEVLETL